MTLNRNNAWHTRNTKKKAKKRLHQFKRLNNYGAGGMTTTEKVQMESQYQRSKRDAEEQTLGRWGTIKYRASRFIQRVSRFINKLLAKLKKYVKRFRKNEVGKD